MLCAWPHKRAAPAFSPNISKAVLLQPDRFQVLLCAIKSMSELFFSNFSKLF